MPVKVQLMPGGASLQVAAQAAENIVTAHFGDGSFWASGVNVTCAQQSGADPGQSEGTWHVRVAFAAQVAAQALVCVARFAQQT